MILFVIIIITNAKKKKLINHKNNIKDSRIDRNKNYSLKNTNK